MADMLTIGTLASSAYKKAIEVTSHNVANVGVEGYHRQRAELVSNSPQIMGNAFLGGGSRVDTVIRVYEDYMQNQLISSNSTFERFDQQTILSKQIEGIVASNDEGVQSFMQRFFDATQSLADDPTNNTNRRMLLDEARNMESHLGNLSNVLAETQGEINNQITDIVNTINKQLEVIQSVNEKVEEALSVGAQLPNDLLDQREEAIKTLSSYVGIKPYRQENGRIDIHTVEGRLPLISDNTLTRLEAANSEYPHEGRVELFMNIGGERRQVSDYIQGGQLGGILDTRNNLLDKAQNELGVMLNGMVAATNWQHYQGWDLNDQAGENFFTPLSTTAINHFKNTGSEDGSNIQISFNPNFASAEPQPPYNPTQPSNYGNKENELNNAFTEIGNFTAREYMLRYRSTTDDFAFYDFQTGEPILDNSGAQITVNNGTQANVEGLNFDFTATNTLADGDRFVVKPHQAILSQFQTEIIDPNAIATRGQSPVDSNNDGSLNDETPAPAAIGDNVNMANIANLAAKKLLYADNTGNASETLFGGYSKMSVNVGIYVQSSEIQQITQESVLQQVTDRIESYSGVNLDEEAANLLKFQQAYEASAQIIRTSQEMFTTIMGVLRG